MLMESTVCILSNSSIRVTESQAPFNHLQYY